MNMRKIAAVVLAVIVLMLIVTGHAGAMSPLTWF